MDLIQRCQDIGLDREIVDAVRDGLRFRKFQQCGLPITFLGHDYHDMLALEHAIDEVSQ